MSLGSDPDVAADNNTPISDQDFGLLSDVISYEPGQQPRELPVLPDPSNEPEKEWLFSDKLDAQGDANTSAGGINEHEEKGDE